MDGKRIEKIREYMDYYRFLEKRKNVSETFFLSLALLFSFLLLFLLMEGIFFFGIKGIFAARILLLAAIAVLSFRFYLGVTCWRKMPYDDLALLLERRFPGLDSHLINAWQLRGDTMFPGHFTGLLQDKAAKLVDKTDPSASIGRKKLALCKKVSALSIILFLLYSSFYPRSARNGLMKILFPAREAAGFLRVEPGNCSIEEGMSLTVNVYMKVRDFIPLIEIKNGGNTVKELLEGKGSFSYLFPEVRKGFYYRIRAGRKSTDWYRVEVKGKTFLEKLFVTCEYPSYTGLKKSRKEEFPGDITVLHGSGITVEAVFSNPVEEASLLLGPGKTIESSGRGEKHIFSFKADNATLYSFRYYDTLSGEYRETSRQRFNLFFDRIPHVEFMEPGVDTYLSGGEELILKVRGGDDFGLASLEIRKQAVKGSFSADDPVIYRSSLRGQKEVLVTHSLRMDGNFEEAVAYYAGCTDNAPSGNKGYSSVYYIYPSGRKRYGAKGEKEEGPEEFGRRAEAVKKTFENFIMEEKKIIEAAKRLDKRQDLSAGQGKIDDIIESQDRWKEFFQKMVDDLHKMASQTKGEFTLADELVEMLAHIQSSNENLKKKAIHMAVAESQTGLELAEEITSNLEKWMAEFPDYIKWDMEEPSKDYDVPEALLPDELEDIIGELIEQEDEMKEEIEDITSSWMDSLDKGAGWGAMDGPISNMSAKGVTGNLMPNQQEIGGRSGEGRTGRSYGEMVEKTATGKGGRRTPARLTPDNLEPGEIEDTSRENPLGPTGGGKISGWGAEGLEGPQQSIAFRYDLLAAKQQKIIEKTESVIREMKVLNVYNPEIEKALSAMKEFQVNLKEGRYHDLLTGKNFIISRLKESDRFFIKSRISMVENAAGSPKTALKLGGVWDEKIPPGYENIVRQYYREIYKK